MCHFAPLVSEGAHPKEEPLRSSAGTTSSVAMTPQTHGHVLYCKPECTTMCRGCDLVANPALATVSPTSGQPARLLHFPDYLLTNHAQCGIGPRLFSRKLRDLCAGPYEDQVIFQGNLFSRLCLSPGRQLIFAASSLLKRPPYPLFH